MKKIISTIFVITLLISCSKDDDISIPVTAASSTSNRGSLIAVIFEGL